MASTEDRKALFEQLVSRVVDQGETVVVPVEEDSKLVQRLRYGFYDYRKSITDPELKEKAEQVQVTVDEPVDLNGRRTVLVKFSKRTDELADALSDVLKPEVTNG